MVRICFAGLLLLLASLTLGCGSDPQAEDPTPAAEDDLAVRILVLDDPGLAETVERVWSERGEGPIEVRAAESGSLLAAERKVLDADLVIYPSGLIGELAERDLIEPLPEQTRRDPNLALGDMHELVRLREMSWNREIHAAAIGAPQLLLLYRRDLLESAGLKPPATWEEFAAASRQLASVGESYSGAAEPLGDGWRGQLLLARAASYLVDASQASALWHYADMAPRLAEPPVVRALEELVAAHSQSLPTPADCYQALLSGKAAMAISWPSRAAAPATPPPLGVARLPGSREVYVKHEGGWEWRKVEGVEPARIPLLGVSGRLVSVTREAYRRGSAAHRLAWLAGKEWSGEVGPTTPGAFICRASDAAAPAGWVGRQWDDTARRQLTETLAASNARQSSLMSVRLPGRTEYLAALDEAVQQALDGKDAKEALEEAATKWREITERLGVGAQRRAYAKSLGL